MSPSLRITCFAGTDEQTARSWIRAHHQALEAGDQRVVKTGTRSVTRLHDGARWVAVKQYHVGYWTQRLRDAMRGSPATRAAAIGLRLQAVGYQISPLLAVAEERGLLGSADSYRLNLWVSEGRSVRQWLGLDPGAPVVFRDPEDVERLARAYAAALGQLHRDALWLPDFRPSNVLLAHPEATPAAIWIDYDTLQTDVRDWRRRLLNLAQMRRSLAPVASPPLCAVLADAYLDRLDPAAHRLEGLLVEFLTPPTEKPIREYVARFYRERWRDPERG